MGAKKIVLLKVAREIKKAEQGDPEYLAHLLSLDKVSLLDEMMNYQEERSSIGHLTLSLMIRGKILFRILEQKAETPELRALARSYRRHLKYELEAYFKTRRPAHSESFTVSS